MTSITVQIEITPQQLADQFITAIESRVGCWLGKITLVRSEKRDEKERIWYADPQVFDGAFLISVESDDPDSDDDGDYSLCQEITQVQVADGLNKMARDFPHQFGLLMHDDGDALTADLLMQCILFGKEIYA